MRFLALFGGLFLLHGTALAADQPHQPLQHDMIVRIDARGQTLRITDQIEISADDFAGDAVALELADFIKKPRFRLMRGGTRLRVSQSKGTYGTLWHLSTKPTTSQVSIAVDYTLDHPKSAQIVVGPDGSFAGSSGDNWYPQIDFARGETGHLTFIARPGETVIATGTRVSSEADAARGVFAFQNTRPAKFAFAAGPYHVQRAGELTIYALPDGPDVTALFARLPSYLSALERMYGRFPFGPPAIVEVHFPTIVLGVSEFGFILSAPSQLAKNGPLYWVHEFAHQWWGDLVRARSRSAAGSLFTEGIAEYSALAVLRETEGLKALRDLRLGRTERDHGSPIFAYWRLRQSGADRAVRNWVAAGGDEALQMHRLSTSKGAEVLLMANDLIGDRAMAAALRSILSTFAGSTASWSDVESSLAQASGRNLETFWDQWLGRPGIADLDLEWGHGKREEMATGSIVQRGTNYSMPVEIELLGSEGRSVRRTVQVDGQATPFSVTADFPVRSVILDPDYRIFRQPAGSDLR